jgi:hypothetical protein
MGDPSSQKALLGMTVILRHRMMVILRHRMMVILHPTSSCILRHPERSEGTPSTVKRLRSWRSFVAKSALGMMVILRHWMTAGIHKDK